MVIGERIVASAALTKRGEFTKAARCIHGRPIKSKDKLNEGAVLCALCAYEAELMTRWPSER